MTQLNITFAVFGDAFFPNKITELSKISPTSFWIKGESIPERKKLTRKETCWEFSTGPVETLHLEEVLESVYKILSPGIENALDYINENNLQVKVDIVVEIYNQEKPSMYFNSDFLQLLTKMGGEIDIDLYILSD